MLAPLALGLCSCLAWAAADEAKIDPDEQARTIVLRSNYVNTFPGAVEGGVAIFGGHVGPYAAPGSGQEPVTPSAGNIGLARSAFGAPTGSTEPRLDFISDTIHRARQVLYRGESGADPNTAAFRYVDLLYGTPDPDEVSGWDPNDVVNLIEARLSTMADFYGDDERPLATDAERELRAALPYAPTSEDLRDEYLDLLYNRVRAETILAKDLLVQANYARMEPNLAGFVLEEEIDAYEQVLDILEEVPRPYFELLQDRMGIDVQHDVDPAVSGNPPFGYYLFQQEVPGRSLFAATYPAPNGPKAGEPVPVLDEDGDGQPDELLTGYKDLALLFGVLRDHAHCAAELAKRYVMRNDEGDMDAARTLIGETLAQLDVQGAILLGIFPDAVQTKALAEVSGLPEEIQSARYSLTELDAVNGFIDGINNVLGFQPDFLMLVQGDGEFFDSYDALASWNDASRVSAPIRIARDALAFARDNYDNFRGTQDQLFEQFDNQVGEYNARLFELVGAVPGEPEYEDPFSNLGSELNLQATSIEVADLQIQKNQQESENLEAEILIEVERRGIEAKIDDAIQQVYVKYGLYQAQLTDEIGGIKARQTRLQNITDFANMFTVSIKKKSKIGASMPSGYGVAASIVNFFKQQEWEAGIGAREALMEQYAAAQSVEIAALEETLLDNESEAHIKVLYLRMSTLALESEEAAMLLSQEWDRLAALLREKEHVETLMAEANIDLVSRYYADPVHRLRFQSATVAAENAFKVAQKWLFFMVRAFEYKWNTPFSYAEKSRMYSMNDVFHARNASEIFDVQTALANANKDMEGFDASDDRFDWFSFREDFLGFMEGGTYVDELTGADVAAVTAFRSYLRNRTDTSGVLTLEFDTVRSDGTFFTGPIFAADGTVATPGLWNDKVMWITVSIPGTYPAGTDDTVLGALTYGGTSFIRNQFTGTLDPETPNRLADEMTAWATRYWYKKDDIWQFKENQTATISINILENPLQPVTVNQINVFKERSVAANGWVLKVFLTENDVQKIDIDNIDDIELYFYHQAKDRIEAK
ncbi:MAG TPA: hypothetical protein VMZ06_11380 [Candidatus Bathyarchaeia archaeon]|nr:hypothetical protein [Candidatus Bathyarchaeia archaeon]